MKLKSWHQIVIFVSLITSFKNVQKNFHFTFCYQLSIALILKGFYQIPLTWSKIYNSEQKYRDGHI